MFEALSWLLEAIKWIGSIAGLAALTWKLYEVKSAWLHLNIDCESDDDADAIKITTKIENKGTVPKELVSAFLVISPSQEGPASAIRKLIAARKIDIPSFVSLNEMVDGIRSISQRSAPASKLVYDGNGNALIPLPYYYNENVRVGVETLTFTLLLSLSTLSPQTLFEIRFYVVGSGRLYRSTQAAFHTCHAAVPPTD